MTDKDLQIKNQVKDYYGKTLQQSEDLKTNACCTAVTYPNTIKKALSNIHDEVLAKYYGCGLTIPTNLKGMSVLDLGSGAGRDCYLLSQLVGENGAVVGIDMTPEQLAVANQHLEYHREKFNYRQSNVKFVEGHIEKLAEAGLQNDQFDVIISNCVINLSPDKEAVLSEAFRVLKTGGEFYFSDVYCDRRIPKHLVEDEVLYGECLSGALYWADFENLAKQAGFTDPRVVDVQPIEMENDDVAEKVSGYNFYSITYRLFKIPELELGNEDYGQALVYRGSLGDKAEIFPLDSDHVFRRGKVTPVSGNTYLMLKKSRLSSHFDFFGDFERHFGTFEEASDSNSFDMSSFVGDEELPSEAKPGGSGCC